ncbi:MAG TPA: hypothetical protein VGB95_04815 [Chitinophagales bacterium]
MVISEIQLFEVLAQELGREKAKHLVEYVEAKVERKYEEKQGNLIAHIDTKIAEVRQEIAESKAETLKWMIVLFAPFYVGMIVFLIKQFL